MSTMFIVIISYIDMNIKVYVRDIRSCMMF